MICYLNFDVKWVGEKSPSFQVGWRGQKVKRWRGKTNLHLYCWQRAPVAPAKQLHDVWRPQQMKPRLRVLPTHGEALEPFLYQVIAMEAVLVVSGLQPQRPPTGVPDIRMPHVGE